MVTAVDVIMNGFIIRNFGATYLVPYAVVNLVLDMAIIFESCSHAAVSFLAVCFGEKNRRGVFLVMKVLLIVSVIGGLIFTAIFTGGCRWVPFFYGIRTPGVYENSVFASAALGLFGVFIGLNYILITGFPYIDRTETGVNACVMHSGVLPLILGLLCGKLWGFRGLIMGIALVPVFTVIVVAVCMLLKNGMKGFPLYLPDNGEKQYVFAFEITGEGRTEVLDTVEKCLKDNDLKPAETGRIRLFLEAMLVRIEEKNKGKKVSGECSVLISDEAVRLFVRDDGVFFDLTDVENTPESLNSYVLSQLMAHHPMRENLMTTSVNRNCLIFTRGSE